MKTKSRTDKHQPSNSAASPRKKRPFGTADAVGLRLKRILVTTDFSNESRKALPYAAAFAQRLGSEVVLLNVLEPPPRFAALQSVVLLQSGDAAVGRVYKGLEALARNAFGTTRRVKTEARTGKPFREIIKAAQNLEADLIIMATHGYSGLKHTFLGSTTERVVREAPCPVLAVRGSEGKRTGRRPEDVTIKRIVLATDFSANSMKAFPLAQDLVSAFDADLTLMYVVERFPTDAMPEINPDTSTRLGEQARTQLNDLARSLCEKRDFKADIVVRFGKPFDEIARSAKALNASLIVLATHGYTGFKHVYLGSVAERVVRHASCPVLVVRVAKR